MLKVFIPDSIPNVRPLALLADPLPSDNRLFQHIPVSEFAGIVESVPLAEATYVLMPHYLTDVRSRPEYLDSVLATARAQHLRPILFTHQDDPSPVAISDAIIFRYSAYRSRLLPNEMLMPAQVEDVGSGGVRPLPKGGKPIVGFMGKAGFKTTKERVKYVVKNYLLRRGADREGVYFRRRALALLAQDARIELNATARTSFSAHLKSIELPPDEARRAYLDSIRDSHFTLAPRGDGNYSLRFYETLALGRMPILIDTDMALPLEDEIPYGEFIVRVPWQELHRLPDIAWSAWSERSDAELAAAGQNARTVFESHLYLPAYLRRVLTPERLAMVS